MIRRATLVFVLSATLACGGLPSSSAASDDLKVVANIAPQTFLHGTLTAASGDLAYAFKGVAGDVVAPDVWPTGGAQNALTPTLALLGPKGPNGHRSAVARGASRDGDARHLSIDGFRLPQTGSYLIVVGHTGSGTGEFSLRLWAQSSHYPRQEASQVDLALTPSPAAQDAVNAHLAAPHAWDDAEVQGLVAGIQQQADARTAFSDAQALLSALQAAQAAGQATDAQVASARDAAAQLVGTPDQFRALDPAIQAFALWWLGGPQGPLFTVAPSAAPTAASDTVAELVASWAGAQEVGDLRRAQVVTLDGVVYGWEVDWSAEQDDVDGSQVWIDFAREWFDSGANWLGEQSAGASEPEDDTRPTPGTQAGGR